MTAVDPHKAWRLFSKDVHAFTEQNEEEIMELAKPIAQQLEQLFATEGLVKGNRYAVYFACDNPQVVKALVVGLGMRGYKNVESIATGGVSTLSANTKKLYLDQNSTVGITFTVPYTRTAKD